MAVEIERKFLVTSDEWRSRTVCSRRVRQGYLSNGTITSVRIRTIAPQDAFLTVKSADSGLSRSEFEYPVPFDDAEAMLQLCVGALIEKTRHFVRQGCHTWEIDVFEGANAGLVVAEVELPHLDATIEYPSWLGEEVTCDRRYSNASLSLLPYCRWRTA